MSTLLMRLAAPLQSWGVDAKYENRRSTERFPTKSGIIGLVASAMGRHRNESIGELLTLKFGVRVDHEGILLRDYHTVRRDKAAYVTNRYYLSDALFLAALEGEEDLLERIEHSLRHPVFPLFLGRRSCPPEGKVSLGIRKGKTLVEALRDEPWHVSEWLREKEPHDVPLRIVTDAINGSEATFIQRDVPLTFDQTHRRYGFRNVHIPYTIVVSNPDSRYAIMGTPTGHDPMLELEEG